MPKDFSRTRRVGEQIQRELADLLMHEVKDPRVHLVTVTGVDVVRDFSQATVYVTTLDPDHADEELLRALGRAAGFLRSQLGRRMKIRSVPALHFQYDRSIENGMRLSALIDSAVASDQHGDATSGEPENPESKD